MADDIFTLDDNNNAAVRTVSVKAGASETNSPVIFTTDENGNAAVRVVGGGDQTNLGYFATPEALEEAYPTAEPGNWAIVGSTDTVWIWNEDDSAWIDSDQKGQVTSVNNQTGDVTVQETLVSGTNIKTVNNNSLLGSGNIDIDALPSQTGNSGKFLTTNGTVASWDTPVVATFRTWGANE